MVLFSIKIWPIFSLVTVYLEEIKKSDIYIYISGLVSDHFWVRRSDSDDDFFQINSKSIQMYWKTVQIYSELQA